MSNGNRAEPLLADKWYGRWWIQLTVAAVLAWGLIFNIAWSTWPPVLRVMTGLACAGFAIAALSNARDDWRANQEAAARRSSAPDIERIP